MFKAFIEAQSQNIEMDSTINKLINHFKIARRDELFYLIGNGDITLEPSLLKAIATKEENIIIRYLKKPFTSLGKSNDNKEKEKEEDDNEFIDRTSTFYIRPEEEQKRYTFAPCCNPIPGEEVVGYVNDNETVTIHKVDCAVANRLKSSFGERLVAARWIDAMSKKSFAATIEINGIDSVGVLNHITQVISRDMAINIRAITIETKDGLFTGKLSIMVNDAKKITTLCNSLKKIGEVKSASRID